MGCGAGGYGGADWTQANTRWVAGMKFEFASFGEAEGFREYMETEHGERVGGKSISEATKEDVLAEALSDAQAGYK